MAPTTCYLITWQTKARSKCNGQFLPLEGSQRACLEENMLDLKDSMKKEKCLFSGKFPPTQLSIMMPRPLFDIMQSLTEPKLVKN